jgi:hypothetical protein
MSLQATIRNATRPVVAKLLGELGSIGTFRRAPLVPQADNSVVKGAWADVANGAGVAVLLTEPTAAEVQRVWGQVERVVVQGMTPVGPDLKPNDGLQVTAGFYAGRNFVVREAKPDDLGQFTLLRLESTTETYA